MTPKELLFAHRYPEAVEAYQSHLRQHPEQNYHGGLGDALLCTGNFSDAAAAFRTANDIEHRELKESSPFINQIGTAMWLAGDKRGAMTEWRRAVDGILDGSIQYGNMAGGASQGLLLWYAAVTLKDSGEHEYALKYLDRLKRKKVYLAEAWPRPVVAMVLGEKSLPEILASGIGSPDLGTCIQVARTDLLKRRFLFQALFYRACREREAGNESACMEKMRACFHLENPIIEVEWYLARGECSKIAASPM